MTAAPHDQPLRGILWMLISALMMALLSVCVKRLTGDYAVLQVIFFRSLVALIALTILIAARRDPTLFRPVNLPDQFWRGTFGFVYLVCLFYSFKLLPLADAMAVGFLNPVFAVLFAILLLRERASLHHWIAIGAGFVGALIMVQPGSSATISLLGIGLGMLGALVSGGIQTRIRILGRTDNPLTTVWFYSLLATLMGAVALSWVWHMPKADDWLWLIATGLCATFGQIAVTKAYQFAPASVTAPFNYSSLLWAAMLDYALWHAMPTPQILAGGAVVFAATSLAAWHERRRRMSPPAPGDTL